METHKFIELEEAKIAKDINFLIQTSSLLIESRQEEKGGFIELKRRIKKAILYQSQLQYLSSEYVKKRVKILRDEKEKQPDMIPIDELLSRDISSSPPSYSFDLIKVGRNLNESEAWIKYENEIQAMKSFVNDEAEQSYKLSPSDVEDLLVDYDNQSSSTSSFSEDLLCVTSIIKTLICPITQQEFREPVINIKCNHTFEKDALIRNGKLIHSKCPVNGCRITSMTLRDIEPDEDMIKRLNRKKTKRIF